jgi:hypothetical protein
MEGAVALRNSSARLSRLLETRVEQARQRGVDRSIVYVNLYGVFYTHEEAAAEIMELEETLIQSECYSSGPRLTVPTHVPTVLREYARSRLDAGCGLEPEPGGRWA